MERAQLEQLARTCPKAELHLHLEGTLEPELMFELAERNRLPLPFASVAEARAAYDFTDLQSFLDVYYAGASVLITEQDFHDLTSAYLRRAAEDGVTHAEVFFDPQTHTARGIAFETVLSGIVSALREGEAELGITWRLIMCFLRDLPEAEADRMLDYAAEHTDVIVGVGLDSAEIGNPPEKFVDVFGRARQLGFLTFAHAGEEGSANDVQRTLDLLKVTRIDHGNHAADDPELVERLVRERIPLTICPLSNVRLRVYDCIAVHPVCRLLDAGVVLNVNSDDPAYFGGYISDNYIALIDELDLTEAQIERIAINSFEASLLPRTEKDGRIGKVRAYFGSVTA